MKTRPIDRVLDRASKRGWNQTELARRLDVDSAHITNWKKRGMPSDYLERAADLFSCSVDELLGRWAMSNAIPAHIGVRPVPIISYVQAGALTEAVDSYARGDAEDWLMTHLDLSSGSFALRLRGQSMYRPDSAESFAEGDVVIIDPTVQPRPGDCVVAKNGHEEATFKKYRPRGLNAAGVEYFELVPLNPDYPTLRSDLEPLRIIGTMMEHRKFPRRG